MNKEEFAAIAPGDTVVAHIPYDSHEAKAGTVEASRPGYGGQSIRVFFPTLNKAQEYDAEWVHLIHSPSEAECRVCILFKGMELQELLESHGISGQRGIEGEAARELARILAPDEPIELAIHVYERDAPFNLPHEATLAVWILTPRRFAATSWYVYEFGENAWCVSHEWNTVKAVDVDPTARGMLVWLNDGSLERFRAPFQYDPSGQELEKFITRAQELLATS